MLESCSRGLSGRESGRTAYRGGRAGETGYMIMTCLGLAEMAGYHYKWSRGEGAAGDRGKVRK